MTYVCPRLCHASHFLTIPKGSKGLSILESILSNISPSHLRVLFVHFPVWRTFRSSDCLEFPTIFPALTDLYLSGLIAHGGPIYTAFGPRRRPFRTPNVQRLQFLRIMSFPSQHHNLAYLVNILAPELKDFKLTFCKRDLSTLRSRIGEFKTFLSSAPPCIAIPSAKVSSSLEDPPRSRLWEQLHPVYLPENMHHSFLPASLRRVVVRFDDSALLSQVQLPANILLGNFIRWHAQLKPPSVPNGRSLVVLPGADVETYFRDGARADGRGYAHEFVEDWMRVNKGEEVAWT